MTGIAMPTLATTSGARSMTPTRETSTLWPARCTPATGAAATGTGATGAGVRQTSSMWTPTPCVLSQGRSWQRGVRADSCDQVHHQHRHGLQSHQHPEQWQVKHQGATGREGVCIWDLQWWRIQTENGSVLWQYGSIKYKFDEAHPQCL